MVVSDTVKVWWDI